MIFQPILDTLAELKVDFRRAIVMSDGDELIAVADSELALCPDCLVSTCRSESGRHLMNFGPCDNCNRIDICYDCPPNHQ